MNKVIQVVTLTADPKVSTYGDNKTRVNFNGAVAKRFKKEGENDNFFQYVAFGATADFINKYFKKGSKMLITGEINNNNYEKDGVTHYGVQILIDSVEFFGKKSDNPAASGDSAPTAKAEKTETTESASYEEYMDF